MRLFTPYLLFSAALCAAQQQDVVFQAGVSLVRVDVAVTDSAGEIIPRLTAEDFHIVDERVAQNITGFSFETEPLDLILLFDTSRGMNSKLHQIVRAIELGFHELRPGDRVAVMTFAENAVQIAPFTADLDAANKTILLKVVSAKFSGSSNPGQAASDAALRFGREPVTQRRRAILMIGDKPGPRAEASIRDLWKADAVFSQLIPDKPGANRILASPLTDQTGGATILAGDPGPAFQDSVRRLRRRYTLYYPLPAAAPGAERHIEVTLSPEAAKRFPGSRIYARTGYVVSGK
ncbi:MAG: VWA domain-containing protein [Terriglobia bacterium]